MGVEGPGAVRFLTGFAAGSRIALAEMFYDAVPKIQLRVYRAYDYSLSL